MKILCRVIGHRWASMVTLAADFCLRCPAVRMDEQRAKKRQTELLRLPRSVPPIEHR